MIRPTGPRGILVRQPVACRQLPQPIMDPQQKLFGSKRIAGFNLRNEVTDFMPETQNIDTGWPNPP
jgi:hypothetical protein